MSLVLKIIIFPFQAETIKICLQKEINSEVSIYRKEFKVTKALKIEQNRSRNEQET